MTLNIIEIKYFCCALNNVFCFTSNEEMVFYIFTRFVVCIFFYIFQLYKNYDKFY